MNATSNVDHSNPKIMSNENKKTRPLSKELRELAKWLEEYETWYAQYQAAQRQVDDTGPNPPLPPPPPPQPGKG